MALKIFTLFRKVDAQHPTVAIMSNNSNQWKNEVVVNELTFNKKNIKNTHKGETQDDEDPDDKPTKQVKTATDLQRLKLEKLLKQPVSSMINAACRISIHV